MEQRRLSIYIIFFPHYKYITWRAKLFTNGLMSALKSVSQNTKGLLTTDL